MTEYLAEHWILSIVVTILLGAIGSGLWDAALKPISLKLGGQLYTVITFGARRSRDKIYKRAAMGHHELPSLYILLIVMVVGISALAATQMRLYVQLYAPEILSVRLVAGCPKEDETKFKECVREQAKEKLAPVVQILSLIAIFITVVIFYRFTAINRMNLVTTYYQQCVRAVRPFLDEKTFKTLEQQYALMTTKEHYEAIISQLATVANDNNSSLPESYI
ncbi:MAG: hypothetical protein IH604_20435 [Burkholderiales bacterium]|nr:hypothetical protein [Burkholderiales bacterium]